VLLFKQSVAYLIPPSALHAVDRYEQAVESPRTAPR
jgi:hypothetical protein